MSRTNTPPIIIICLAPPSFESIAAIAQSARKDEGDWRNCFRIPSIDLRVKRHTLISQIIHKLCIFLFPDQKKQ